MENAKVRKVQVTGLVTRGKYEGRPVFAVGPEGSITHVGFTSQGFKLFVIPADTVAIAWPFMDKFDGTVFVHEAEDGMAERAVVSTWRHKGTFAEALAAALGVPVDSEAVIELLKRVAKRVR